MTSLSPAEDEWSFPNAATPEGSAAYYAVRFSPEPLRDHHAGMLAWFALTQQLVTQSHDPGVSRLKIDWWRQEIGRMLEGSARHPLAVLLQAQRLDANTGPLMLALLDSAEDEIRAGTICDDESFASACRNSGGLLFQLLGPCADNYEAQPDRGRLLGQYWSAIERIRYVAQYPHRVPRDLHGEGLRKLDPSSRQARLEQLIPKTILDSRLRDEPVVEVARRLAATSRAMHRKMIAKGYPIADTLIDRAPIAHLWTAWRCR